MPAPSPDADEVILAPRACGICGSDLHWYLGHGAPPRVCPGHEIVGEVVACGEAVRGVHAGDRVAVEPMAVCGRCRECRAGRPQLCARLRILGMQRDGGLAERVAVPAAALFALPAELDWELAALTEPTAVAVHAARLAGIGPGQRVLVLGAGSVGLLCTLAARAAGAAEVWITARHPQQAGLASQLGAQRVFAASPAADVERRALAREQPIDVVLETVGGTAPTLADAIDCVRPGGVVAMLGVFTAPPLLPATTLLVKEARLVGSMMYDRRGVPVDFAAALGLLVSSRQQVAPLITHRFPLASVSDAFAAAADKSAGAVKVLVTP
ncbi:MAG: alcohol dehydrogenase catalytic domain-containing protein [Deltaproteobacteria bacterium]|nr:alcohol dehydrogenase catalytic domain-containing protein [Deltaproteobacteria bacterium]